MDLKNRSAVALIAPLLSAAVNDARTFSGAGTRRVFLAQLVHALGAELAEAGILDVGECFMDGMFAPAKKGGRGAGKTKLGKGGRRS